MTNPATYRDVESRWRPLSSDEQILVTSWLDDAWMRLRVLSPGIESRMQSGATPVDAVIFVLCEAASRKAQNPEGRRQNAVAVDDASRSWTSDPSRATGTVAFTSEELALVSGRPRGVRAFSVQPS